MIKNKADKHACKRKYDFGTKNLVLQLNQQLILKNERKEWKFPP